MGGKYGPNSDQTERFLAKLGRLTAEDWAHIWAVEPTAMSAYGTVDWDSIHLTALQTLGQRDAERLLTRIEARMPGMLDAHGRHRATVAAMCLALAGELTDAQVAAGYAPFTETIPVADLGPGRAGRIEPPPKTAWERFITRLRALEPPERLQIVNLAYSVQAAVGVEGIDRAIEATDPTDPGFLERGGKEIKQLVDVQVDRMTGLYERMAEVIGRRSFAEALAARSQTEGDAFRLCATRALIAVMSQGRMPEREFAILYTPFAGLIPIESLTPAESRFGGESKHE